jgi:phosphoribosylaminoimidazole-succinocarboxamide synthase
MYRGKVRDVWEIGIDHLLIYTTDRVSAFDVILPTPIPGRGEILTKFTRFWCDMTQYIVPNHIFLAQIGLDEALPDKDERPNACKACQIVRRLTPLPIEAIVRGYLFGSAWDEYRNTGTISGIKMPDGLVLADRLPEPVFTPSTKAPPGRHDVNITFEMMDEIVGAAVADKVRQVSLAIYAMANTYAEERGLIIADTKLEFGLDQTGQVILMDEVLTPDSSRYWDAATYNPGFSPPSFDKQILRDYLHTLDWDKKAPGPELSQIIVEQMQQKYANLASRLGM